MAKGRKTGGRKAGTPNKNNPLKQYLREHSAKYFQPLLKVDEALCKTITPADAEPIDVESLAARLGVMPGEYVSRYDIDSAALPAAVRVDAEIKLLNYTQSKMQNTTVDMSVTDASTQSLEERLANLAISDN